MNHLEILLMCSTIAFEVVLCVFVFARETWRVLPLFTAYASVLFASSVGMLVVYEAIGYHSLEAYYYYWGSILLNAAMRSIAVGELCRYKLSAYRGIWELVWRGLTLLSILFLAHAAFDTWGQPNHLAIYSLTLDRDLDIASVAILAALLLIHNYYELSLEPLQRTIAIGISFICTVDAVGDTIVRSLYTGYLFPFFMAGQSPLKSAVAPSYTRINDLWSTVHLFCFMAAMGIWCYALRKPIPERGKAPVLLPAEVYREISPAINLRLRAFNDRLLELLKP